MKRGKPHGTGTKTWPDESEYIGEFSLGKEARPMTGLGWVMGYPHKVGSLLTVIRLFTTRNVPSASANATVERSGVFLTQFIIVLYLFRLRALTHEKLGLFAEST